MTKEFALLIAQIVPVLALALGLEIRSLTLQIVGAVARNNAESDSSSREDLGAELLMARILIGALSITQSGLVALETKAIEVAFGGAPAVIVDMVLAASLLIVFMAPVYDCLYRLIPVVWPGANRPIRYFVTLVLAVVLLAAMSIVDWQLDRSI
ncbi:hypothetical protein J2S43_007868 [Catenuloplanes nepalensis]|uniref:Uncharacterized protein n=1 Tax=Catenuloplanes nepalensis TaxID=587533 RepID=A0ABT9N7X6_9ACTN|nr:hypothetical protein [Catenuloplanes nepalensis]MDP9799356.1 hypothetical protein [Catenuloplanes nepalensis]